MKTLPSKILEKMAPADRRKHFPGNAGLTADECRSKALKGLEKDLQKQLSALLNRRGIPYINPPMHKASSLPLGWPDYSIFLPGGKTIFWEAKVNSSLRPDQAKVRDILQNNGHEWRLIRSLFEAQEHLREVEAK